MLNKPLLTVTVQEFGGYIECLEDIYLDFCLFLFILFLKFCIAVQS